MEIASCDLMHIFSLKAILQVALGKEESRNRICCKPTLFASPTNRTWTWPQLFVSLGAGGL